MYTPVNPSFTIQKWGLRGSELYRRVFVVRMLYSDKFMDRSMNKSLPSGQVNWHKENNVLLQ